MTVEKSLEASVVLNSLILTAATSLTPPIACAQPAALPPTEITHADAAPDPSQFPVVELGRTELLPAGFDWGQSSSGDEGAGSALLLHDTAEGSLTAEAGVPSGQSGRAYGIVKLQKWFRVAQDPSRCGDSATATITMRLRHAALVEGNNYTLVIGACLAAGEGQAAQRAWLDYFAASPVPTPMNRPYEPGTATVVLPNVTLEAGQTYCLMVTVSVLAQGGPSTGEAPPSGADIVLDPEGFSVDDTFVTFSSGTRGEGVLA